MKKCFYVLALILTIPNLYAQHLDDFELKYFLSQPIDYSKTDTLLVDKEIIQNDTLKEYVFGKHNLNHVKLNFNKDTVLKGTIEYSVVLPDTTWSFGTNMFTIWNLEIYDSLIPLKFDMNVGQKISHFQSKLKNLKKVSDTIYKLIEGEIVMIITVEQQYVRSIELTNNSDLHPHKKE